MNYEELERKAYITGNVALAALYAELDDPYRELRDGTYSEGYSKAYDKGYASGFADAEWDS